MMTVVRPHSVARIERLLALVDGIALIRQNADDAHLPRLETSWGPAIKHLLCVHCGPDLYHQIVARYEAYAHVHFANGALGSFDAAALISAILAYETQLTPSEAS